MEAAVVVDVDADHAFQRRRRSSGSSNVEPLLLRRGNGAAVVFVVFVEAAFSSSWPPPEAAFTSAAAAAPSRCFLSPLFEEEESEGFIVVAAADDVKAALSVLLLRVVGSSSTRERDDARTTPPFFAAAAAAATTTETTTTRDFRVGFDDDDNNNNNNNVRSAEEDDDDDDSEEDLLYLCAHQDESPFSLLCGGVKVELVCDMNHDCPLKGMPFRGTHLKLCHSTEMRLVLGEGYSRRLVSREGELPSGYCDAERHVYKPGNCDAVFVDPKQLQERDPAFFKERACKTCPAQAAALYCHNCVTARPRRRKGLFCAKCNSGPACCLAADRFRYRHLSAGEPSSKRPHRSKDERRAHLSPCGLCGALYCRNCIHESRVCCNDCFTASDLDFAHDSDDDDDDY